MERFLSVRVPEPVAVDLARLARRRDFRSVSALVRAMIARELAGAVETSERAAALAPMERTLERVGRSIDRLFLAGDGAPQDMKDDVSQQIMRLRRDMEEIRAHSGIPAPRTMSRRRSG